MLVVIMPSNFILVGGEHLWFFRLQEGDNEDGNYILNHLFLVLGKAPYFKSPPLLLIPIL